MHIRRGVGTRRGASVVLLHSVTLAFSTLLSCARVRSASSPRPAYSRTLAQPVLAPAGGPNAAAPDWSIDGPEEPSAPTDYGERGVPARNCVSALPAEASGERGRWTEEVLAQQASLLGKRVRLTGTLYVASPYPGGVVASFHPGRPAIRLEVSPVPRVLESCFGSACVTLEATVSRTPGGPHVLDKEDIELVDPVLVARSEACGIPPMLETHVSIPPSFDARALADSLDSIARSVAECGVEGGPTGEGHVRITFDATGAVRVVRVDGPPYATTSVGGCVARKFKAATGARSVLVRKRFVLP